MQTTPTTAEGFNAAGGKLTKTAAYYLAFIGLGMVGAALGPTLPGLAENTGARLSEISYLFTTRSLGYLLGSVMGGRMYDRVAGHRLMAIVLLALAAAVALVPTIPLLPVLMVLMVLLGAFEGTVDVGGNTMLVWVHHPKTGPFMNGLHFFFGVGAFLSPVLIAQVMLLTGGITWSYWMLALILVPIALVVLRLPSPSIQRVEDAAPSRQVNYLLVTLLALFFFLNVGAEVAFGGWIYTYTVTLNLAGTTQAAYLTSLFWGTFTAGRLLGIPIAARVRPRWILLGDLLVIVVGLLIILFGPNPNISIWIGTIMIGLGMASVFPTLISFAEHHMALSGKITSYFFVGASLGGMTIPWLIGQLFDSIGPRYTMITLLVDVLLTLGIYVALILYAHKMEQVKGEVAIGKGKER
jgi:MFS transporter, FHS family, Na+ dependent glucose transporter 1